MLWRLVNYYYYLFIQLVCVCFAIWNWLRWYTYSINNKNNVNNNIQPHTLTPKCEHTGICPGLMLLIVGKNHSLATHQQQQAYPDWLTERFNICCQEVQRGGVWRLQEVRRSVGSGGLSSTDTTDQQVNKHRRCSGVAGHWSHGRDGFLFKSLIIRYTQVNNQCPNGSKPTFYHGQLTKACQALVEECDKSRALHTDGCSVSVSVSV